MNNDFFPVFAAWARKHGLQEARTRFALVVEERTLAEFCEEYERRIESIEIDNPPVLHGPRSPWYPGPNYDNDQFWPTLRAHFLTSLKWSEPRLQPVDQASSKVLAYTPRPQESEWDSKGLVVGYVQSGKTTNFTSVIAKAADVGYKLVIVLSGIHNGLRRQTQERLDSQLHNLIPTSWLTLTDQDNDFRTHAMSATALLHNLESKVALCVVKKNSKVLTKLDNWLADAARSNVLKDVPVLIVDDEADQATVATEAINPLIRGILSKLPKATYIGYTATPFANVLIRPGKDDLYPDDFILNLPKPDGYFGSESIFGRQAVEGEEANGSDLDGFDMVRYVDQSELPSLRPLGKAAAADFEPEITSSLKEAIQWFWLATAARRARGDHEHSTMLIHTSMKIAVHESFKEPLLDLRDSTLRKLRDNDVTLFQSLQNTWDVETHKVPASSFGLQITEWSDLLKQLEDVVASTKVVLDNCKSEDRLDYGGTAQTAIVVGGNTLSRGLTLEGLIVSFFVRAAQAYDTLLQMARWFGFRPGYEDLPRIWMTGQLEGWFRHLATVEHEIRLDIERYEQQGLTPREFGIRIRTHPILRITAKMGAAAPAYASFGGRRIQTRYFKESDQDWLQRNLDAADSLVRDSRAISGIGEPLVGGGTLFREVTADVVMKFVREYACHVDSPDLDRQLMLAYIEEERRAGSLNTWSVAVMGSPDDRNGSVRLGGLAFGRIERAALRSSSPERADIKTLMSKDHRVVDLPISLSEARAMNESSLMDARNSEPTAKKQALLLIYPIDPESKPNERNELSRRPLQAKVDVIGMAVVFPGNAQSRVRTTHVSVDLSSADVEEPDVAEYEELTRMDTE